MGKRNFDQNLMMFMMIIYINNGFAKDCRHHQCVYNPYNSPDIQPPNKTILPQTPNIPHPLNNNLHNPPPITISRLTPNNRILSNNKLNISSDILYMLYIT